MNDDLTTLEQLLRERAAEVPSLQEAPRNVLMRARRRVLRNALSSAVAVGLIVFGASAGIASLGASQDPDIPGHSGGAQSPPGGFSSATCTSADLRATSALQGGMGSVFGKLVLTNFTDKTCTLTGRPTVTLFTSAGRQLTVQEVASIPQWRADKTSPPNGWPIVDLPPGSSAAVRVRWSNACPQLSEPALWKVGLPGGGSLDVFGADGTSPPPCNGTAEPSTLEVGPFEPNVK
jgi:hypothetical protein